MKTKDGIVIVYRGGPFDGVKEEYMGGDNYRHWITKKDGITSHWYDLVPDIDEDGNVTGGFWKYRGITRP